MTTYTEAVDLMYGRVRELWNAQANASFGYIPTLVYEGTATNNPQPTDRVWGRVSEELAIERLAAFGSGRQDNRSLYRSVGTLYVELYLPRQDKTSKRRGRSFMSIVRSGFRGYTADGNLNFRDHTVRTPATERNWYRYTFVVTYEFYETD